MEIDVENRNRKRNVGENTYLEYNAQFDFKPQSIVAESKRQNRN